MMKPRVGSLFSGTGMLDHGVQQFFDAELAFFAEYEPPTKQNPRPTQAPARILAKHFPDVPNLGDVSKVDWSLWFGLIEILSGGFPCQDVSLAGARAGITVDSRSGMWQHYALAISILRPSLVIIENVRGLLSAKAGDHDEVTDDEGWTDEEIAQLEAEYPEGGGGDRSMESGAPVLGEPARDGGPVLNAFGSVLGDLAELGYVAVWIGVQASDAGAPHARFRVFIVARPADDLSSRDWPRAAENPDRAARDQRGEPATGEATGGGHGPTLADELEHEFRRATAADAEGLVGERAATGGREAATTGRAARRRPADDGHGAAEAVALFPTTTAADGDRTSGTYARGNMTLSGAADLLPTPAASIVNDGEDPATWQARHDFHAAKENATRSGMPLTVATVLLPTVQAHDAKQGKTPAQVAAMRDATGAGVSNLNEAVELFPTPSTSNASGNATNNRGELLLPGVAESLPTALLRTPTATEAERGTLSAEYAAGPRAYDTVSRQVESLPTADLLPTPTKALGDGGQTSRSGDRSGEQLLPGILESLPSPRLLRTPVAAEGTKATTRQGVDQKSESGQVWLTNEVHDLPTPDKQPGGIDLIPTPTSRDWKDGAENANVPINGLLGRTVWDSELPDGAPENSVEAYEQLWDSLDDQSPFWKTEKADYWPAIYRWSLIMGRKAPAPTVPDGKGGRFRLSAKFAEWMMGMPLGWVTACGLTRNEELKACGNGVVWQQASLALHVLMPMLWELAA